MANQAAKLNVRAIDDLEDLANVILASAKTVKSFLSDNKIPAPSFSVGAPSTFPECPQDVRDARNQLLDASKKLHQLALGPIDHLIDYSCSSGTNQDITQRMLRYLMTSNIFHEPRPGFVAHTAGSKLLTVPGPRDLVYFATLESTPWAASYVETFDKWGCSEEPNETAFNYTSGSSLPVYKAWDKDPVRGPRFGRGMDGFQSSSAYHTDHMVEGWDWQLLSPGSTVVDIGGSRGTVSYALARAFPNPKFVVQDLPEIVSKAQEQVGVEREVASRVSFVPHDFFSAQPVKNAEVYFLRMILHNYSDKYAVKILHHLMPAMKKGPGGSKLLIADQVMQPMLGSSSWDSGSVGSNGISARDESAMRFLDLQMLIMLNAKEREMVDWEALFRRASEGREEGVLQVTGHRKPEGGVHSIIVVELLPRGDE
ncbi:O-methyltransferase [Diaporthe eres]|nr:O-methyltransferase [Diaporthe eres]